MNQIKKDRLFQWSLVLSIIFILFCVVIFALSWNNFPPSLPLYYSLPWGEEQLAPPITLGILILGTIALISTINLVSSFLTFKNYKYYSQILLIANPIIAILTAITILQIVLLIT